jgi:hypothetical protein
MTPGVWVSLIGLGVSILLAAAAALIWFVRLEGRVNTLKELHEQFKEIVGERHAEIGERINNGFAKVDAALEKIFDRLDKKADK